MFSFFLSFCLPGGGGGGRGRCWGVGGITAVTWIVKLESGGSRLSLPYKGRICEMLCDLSTGGSVRCSIISRQADQRLQWISLPLSGRHSTCTAACSCFLKTEPVQECVCGMRRLGGFNPSQSLLFVRRCYHRTN